MAHVAVEPYSSADFQHGPIALIDEKMPVIVLAPSDELFDKTASNLQEAHARGGKIVFISDKEQPIRDN